VGIACSIASARVVPCVKNIASSKAVASTLFLDGKEMWIGKTEE
jgi:hypothetical protein